MAAFDPNQILESNLLESRLSDIASVAESVPLAMREPMTVSFGTFYERPSGWLTITGQVDGRWASGYGEGATLPQPVFTDDSGGNIAGNIRQIMHSLPAQATAGEVFTHLQSYGFADGGRYPTARLTSEMAVLDMLTHAKDTSVREAIGVPDDITEVPYGKSIGGKTRESIVRQAELALASQALKIKVKVSPALFCEVMPALQTIRKEHPDIDMMVDANGGFDPDDTEQLDMLRALDQLDLIMIEEPVSRVGAVQGLDAIRRLHANLPDLATPLCLDDCLATSDDCYEAIDGGLARIINIKPARIGSFLRSVELANYAKAADSEVMVGGMMEATPGRCMTTLLGAHCLALGFRVPGDLSLAQERLAEDLVEPNKQLSLSPHGGIVLPRGKGWGF